MSRYKVVETSLVTDESIETILNDWTGRGWTLEGIHFAMRESSRRPAMAFVCFIREGAAAEDAAGAAAGDAAPKAPAGPRAVED